MKRREDNRQISKEAFESANDEEDEQEEESSGPFQRASADVLASRKIIKAKRPAASTVSSNGSSGNNAFASVNLTSSSSTMSASNPFASFSGFTTSQFKPSPIPGTAPAPVSMPPFNNLPSTAKVSNENSSQSSNKQQPPATTSSQQKGGLVSETGKSHSNISKFEKLNKSFSGWIEKQIKNHPVSNWKEGLQDYLDYAKKIFDEEAIQEKPKATSIPTSSNDNKSSLSSADKNSTTQSTASLPSVLPPAPSPGAFSFNAKMEPNTLPAVEKPIETQKQSSAEKAGGFTIPKFESSNASFSFTASKDSKVAPSFSFSTQALAAPTTSAIPPFPSTSTFSFGTSSKETTSKENTSNPPAAVSSFTFGSNSNPALSAQPTSEFKFAGLSAQPTSDFKFAGFSASNSLSTTFPKPPSSTNDDEGGDGDGEGDDAMPILEPEKVLRNQDDKSETLYEIDCKLYRFDKKQNEWKEMGKGILRIIREEPNAKKQLVIRNALGKIMLNMLFYKELKFEKIGKNGIKFIAQLEGIQDLSVVMIKVKIEELDKAKQTLEDGVN